MNGLARSHSDASTATIGGRPRADSNLSQDDNFIDNRGSVALDSLANELDALRNHWESTSRSYRLSTNYDADRTPTKETHEGSGLSASLTSWRRRLEEEDDAKASYHLTPATLDKSKGSPITPVGASEPPIEHQGNMI